MRHGTNFIFSNRDLRSPQASTPTPFSLCPEMHCRGLLFSPRESIFPSLASIEIFFRAQFACRYSDISSVAPRKHKKRYLYESVFWFFFFFFFFAATLPLSSRSFISIELPSRVFLRARLVPWRPFHPAPSGNRNEGRK